MSIGENIKKWRELRNLRQSELAEMLNVSDKTISSWEIDRTEPKIGMIEKISEALNCKKTDIIGIDNIADKENIKKNDTDQRLQKIINCFNGMNEEGKDFLTTQAEICYRQFAKSKSKDKAM